MAKIESTLDDIEKIAPSRQDWLTAGVACGMVRAADLATLAMSGWLAWLFDQGQFMPPSLEAYGIVIALFAGLNIYQVCGVYDLSRLTNLYEQARRIGLCWVLLTFFLLVLGFWTSTLESFSRGWVGLWLSFTCFSQFTVRMLARSWISGAQRNGRLKQNIVVVGAGEHGRRFVEQLRMGDDSINLVGLFDDRKDRVPDYIAGFPVLGTIDELIEFTRKHRIDQIVVALPSGAERRLLNWLDKLRALPVDLRLVPDMIGCNVPHQGIVPVAGVPLLRVAEKPLTAWNSLIKLCEDRLISLVILAFVMPLMAIIAVGIKFTSKGPVFYKQKRYGFNNEVIEIYKFRTMRTDTQSEENCLQAARDDPRITSFGRLLRQTSLDELPQFINVLKGEMSIVGPRPHAVAHNEHYARLIDDYFARHKVKPGITGWAQINGLRGETDTLEKMQQRVQCDLYYIEQWSLALDLKIIFMTVLVGFVHPNAH